METKTIQKDILHTEGLGREILGKLSRLCRDELREVKHMIT
jgi:hypothetical protein